MTLKDWVIGGAAVLALMAGVVALNQPNSAEEPTLGANPGNEPTEHMYLNGGLTVGGGIRATTTDDTTATFLSGDLNYNRIDFVPMTSGITATLPASSTLRSFAPIAGQSRSMFLCNKSTTNTFTLAFGTGMNVHQATSTLVIETGDCATLDFSRATTTDLDTFYDLGY